ncbi:MAG: hypothetical protein M1821_002607 [Bathelium mastoideum]|nr:MAG: hypothetical protein M1821_002607 [Bathelium mastoideum]
MSLLLIHELRKSGALPAQSHFTGVDISQTAVDLASLNKKRVFQDAEKCAWVRSGVGEAMNSGFERSENLATKVTLDINFVAADIFTYQFTRDFVEVTARAAECNIVMANPPYISPADFNKTTARSVRNFEPRLALVPPNASDPEVQPGDAFYPRILEIAKVLRAKCLLVEVADMDQAIRVARMIDKLDYKWARTEIWRDDPSYHDVVKFPGTDWLVRGRGNGRSVFAHNFADLPDSDI